MKLPKVISNLVAAQNRFDSTAYADCFSETAIVHDEGEFHKGKTAIAHWIAEANEKYQATMTAVDFKDNGATAVLAAEVSGTFPGSPIVLKYQLEMSNDLIQSLKITS